LMYEARLVANSLYEIYKVCEAKVLWVMEAMWEIWLRETIYHQHPGRIEIFEWILKRFRKLTSLIKNGKTSDIINNAQKCEETLYWKKLWS
jgi:hypothetical protein